MARRRTRGKIFRASEQRRQMDEQRLDHQARGRADAIARNEKRRGIDMSADGPAVGGPQEAPDGGSEPFEPEVTARASAEPARAQHTIEPTRTSRVWTMVGIGVVLLVAILVFIMQNGQHARVRFLMADGTLPLGVALLFAALLGALLVLVAGAARVLQLRVVARRHRRADQAP
jgi:putative membrane protein